MSDNLIQIISVLSRLGALIEVNIGLAVYYDGPNGSLFILYLNTIPISEFRNMHCESELGIVKYI